jgi:hypothetical protein
MTCVAGIVAAPQPQDTSSAAVSAKTWVGRQQEIEDYLKRAEVVRMEETKVGVTRPAHAYLAPGGPISEMAWKALPASAVRNGYRESYKAELAAYEMDHSRTFRYGKSLTHELTHIDRALWDRMKGLTRDQLATTFGSLLDERDINGILDRCEVMQRSIDKLVKSKGEAAVFTNWLDPEEKSMTSIRIRYCKVWNYYPRAARAAALIKDETGLESELIEGGRGEFTVWVGEDLAAKKTPLGFPTDEEILRAIQKRLSTR